MRAQAEPRSGLLRVDVKRDVGRSAHVLDRRGVGAGDVTLVRRFSNENGVGGGSDNARSVGAVPRDPTVRSTPLCALGRCGSHSSTPNLIATSSRRGRRTDGAYRQRAACGRRPAGRRCEVNATLRRRAVPISVRRSSGSGVRFVGELAGERKEQTDAGEETNCRWPSLPASRGAGETEQKRRDPE